MQNQKPGVIRGDHLQKCKLLVTVVDRKKAEFYVDYLGSHRINLQTVMRGHGTASTEMLSMLGLDTAEKAVILSVIREDHAAAALAGLEEKFRTVRNGKGIAFTIPLSSVIGASVYRFMSDARE